MATSPLDTLVEACQRDPDASGAVDFMDWFVATARTNYAAFVSLVHRPRFTHSAFSAAVCREVDAFVDDLLAGKNPVLMLTAPPQHGKSSLISRCLAPYLYGRLTGKLPAVRIANATYALPLARRNATDAKSIMLEPMYRAIFPALTLIGFKGNQNTSSDFDVPLGGQFRAVGIGGPLTGFSVDCFAPDTLVDTDQGPIRVDELHLHAKTCKVLSYHHGELRYASIKAVGHRQATRLYRITTDAGRILKVTGNHPVFANGHYVNAAKLATGDVLLCAVPDSCDAHRSGLREITRSVDLGGTLLRQDVHGASEATRDTQVSGLRRSDSLARRSAMCCMPKSISCAQEGTDCAETDDDLRDMRNAVHFGVESWCESFLFGGLQERRTCSGLAGGRESQLESGKSEIPETQRAGRALDLALCPYRDVGARPAHVPDLQIDTSAASPSHQRESDGSFTLQFADPLRPLPSAGASRAHGRQYETDTVRMVDIIDAPVRVYDVQVEADECLFANGVLAHNCAIIDDATKNAEEALSPVVQDGIEAWFDSVLLTRLQQVSGLVIIGTPWAARDILGRVKKKYAGQANFKLLSFPALNRPGEHGYNPDLPEGALVPSLHSEAKLLATKRVMSDFWWAALYQQTPLSDVGAIFPLANVQYYRRAELNALRFVQTVMTVDATFKDGTASDYVAVGVWGKTADDRVWLLGYRRARLAFLATAQAIADLRARFPRVGKIYIEEAANGAALLDMLRKHYPNLEDLKPTGSKEARAHAVSWVWTNNCVMLPHPEEDAGIQAWVDEITMFPDVEHDDTVDCMVHALNVLCARTPISALITRDILNRA